MDAHCFKLKKVWRIFFYILYLPFCGLFLFSMVSPWILPEDIKPWEFEHLLFIGISIPMLTVFTMGLYEAYYGYLLIEEHQITLNSSLYKRTLSDSEIEGFRVNDKYITLFPLKNVKKKKIPISRYVEKEDELIDLLNSKYTDLDAAEISIQLDEIANNEVFGSNSEERLKNLERITNVVNYSNYAAIGIALWTMYFPVPYILLMCVCMIVPFLNLLISKVFKNKILFDTPQNHALPSIGLSSMMFSLALVIRVISDFNLLSYEEIFMHTGLIGCMLSVFYYFNKSEIKLHWSYSIFSIVLLFIYSFGLNVSINCLLDNSNSAVQKTVIVEKRESGGKHTSYYFDIVLPKDTIELSVNSDVYDRYEASDSIRYRINKGYLDTPWIEIYE